MRHAFVSFHSWGRPRPEYIVGQRPREPEKAESAFDLYAFYRAFPDATCSPKIALVLATLMREYAPEKEGADATHRTPGHPGPAGEP